MAQIATSTRAQFFQMNRWVLLLLFLGGLFVSASAQLQPYLLLQGPSGSKTYRFVRGQELEWRFHGEDEFFSARIIDFYPESQTIRIDDILVSINKFAEVRYRKNGAGLKKYLQGQGLVNLVFLGGFTAFSKRTRREQKNFLIVAAIVSAAMVIYGSFGRYVSREVGPNQRYLLKIAGGDLRLRDGRDLYDGT